VLLGLTTDQKLGLGLTAAVFIAFALLTALVIPRYRPDFPGRGLGVFIVVTIVLTIAMLGAVEVFAVEEEHGAAEAPAETGETETTETTETETAPPTTTAEEEPAGDADAGQQVFAASGCGSCHTVAAAGASGTAGPNLDESLADKDAEYIRRAIVDPNSEVVEGYQPGIMPDNYEQQLSPKQLDDLVAFLAD
jgi:mono/diheme cytochrome c family protein